MPLSLLMQVKSLRSQLEEISTVLSGIPAPLQDVPAVTAFQDGATASSSPAPTAATAAAANGRVLDWSALPAAVGPEGTAMGVSTKKKAAYKPAKQKVDVQKVQARADRKRAQVGHCNSWPASLCTDSSWPALWTMPQHGTSPPAEQRVLE